DMVPRRTLLAKLRKSNFSDRSVRWFASYLCGHTQAVVGSDDVCSEWLPTTSGVPQGSVLGPLLFSIFINDLPNVIVDSKHMLFADDLQVYYSFFPHDLEIGIHRLNQEIAAVVAWATGNGLSLNVRKMKAIILTSDPYYRQLDLQHIPHVALNSVELPYSAEVQCLGLWIQTGLDWSRQRNFLMGFGAPGGHFTTRTILQELLTNELAMKFSFKEKKCREVQKSMCSRTSLKFTRIEKKSTWISSKPTAIAYFLNYDRSTRNPCIIHVESLYDLRGIPLPHQDHLLSLQLVYYHENQSQITNQDSCHMKYQVNERKTVFERNRWNITKRSARLRYFRSVQLASGLQCHRRTHATPKRYAALSASRQPDENNNDAANQEGFALVDHRRHRQRNQPVTTAESARPRQQPKPRPAQHRVHHRPDAIVIKAKDASTYADILRKLKSEPTLQQSVGSSVQNIRRSAAGALVLQLRKNVDNASTLGAELGKVLGDAATASALQHTTMIEIRDLDECVTKDEIAEALGTSLGTSGLKSEVVRSLRKAYAGTQAAVAALPDGLAARALKLGHIRIGWVNCRIRGREDTLR
ncbi:unnamed protein product, partial [Trichogramma brassicae]